MTDTHTYDDVSIYRATANIASCGKNDVKMCQKSWKLIGSGMESVYSGIDMPSVLLLTASQSLGRFLNFSTCSSSALVVQS